MIARLTLIGAGVAAGLYGVRLLLREGVANLVASAEWLVGGVIAHDAVLAPATILLAWLAVRVAPRAWLAPLAVGVVVVAPVTLLGIPVLGRFGAKTDNPTLLDRNYGAGWALLVAIVWIGILAVAARTRLMRRRTRGQGARG